MSRGWGVGIAVGAGEARVIALRRGAVVWAETAPWEDLAGLREVLTGLLRAAPRPRVGRPDASAAVGPCHCQTRRLTGLPPLGDPRLVAQLVRQGTSRFFLQNGIPVVTSGVRVEAPGTAWAAAFERPVVDAVRDACTAARVRLTRVVPAVLALPHALAGQRLVWPDGDVTAEVCLEGGGMGVRRLAGTAGRLPGASESYPAGPLASLGDRAFRFADAYGVVHLPAGERVALVPGAPGFEAAPVTRRRLMLSALLAAAGITFALLAPGVSAEWRHIRASSALTQLADERRAALGTAQALDQVTLELGQLAALSPRSRSALWLLAQLTRTLPDPGALVTVRLDSTTVVVAALVVDAGRLVAALERAEGIVAPEIVGPITRERVGTQELERITIRFGLGVAP